MQPSINSEIARILVEERIVAAARVRPLAGVRRERRKARRLPGLRAALRLA